MYDLDVFLPRGAPPDHASAVSEPELARRTQDTSLSPVHGILLALVLGGAGWVVILARWFF